MKNIATWIKTANNAGSSIVNLSAIEEIRLDEGSCAEIGGPVTHACIIADHIKREARFYLTGSLPVEDAQAVLDALPCAMMSTPLIDMGALVNDTLHPFDTTQTDQYVAEVIR